MYTAVKKGSFLECDLQSKGKVFLFAAETHTPIKAVSVSKYAFLSLYLLLSIAYNALLNTQNIPLTAVYDRQSEIHGKTDGGKIRNYDS